MASRPIFLSSKSNQEPVFQKNVEFEWVRGRSKVEKRKSIENLHKAGNILGIQNILQRVSSHSHVINGRFRGGWTTRHYGQPQHGVHAIQMELAQRTYLETESPPFDYDSHKASSLRPLLSDILHHISDTILKHSEGASL